MKRHSCNLYAPFCRTFVPNPVAVASYDSLIRIKVPQTVTHILQKTFSKHALNICNGLLVETWKISSPVNTEHTHLGEMRVENREVINDVLVHLFNEIMELEEQAIITEDYKDITNNDMHIIEAVGLGGNKMSDIAAKLNITVGSLTTSMNSLVKKGYVVRERGQEDRRVVYISLSDRGRKAFEHHARFHREMIDGVTGDLSEEEMQVLVKALSRLDGWFREKERQNQ